MSYQLHRALFDMVRSRFATQVKALPKPDIGTEASSPYLSKPHVIDIE